MQNINEILARAAALRDETQLNSISPERAGGIMYDTLLALNDLWLQQGAALVISKIYASVAAMEADTAPVSDLTGKPLRPGQIVVIASSDSDNGSVYRYNGTDSPSWSLVGDIGNLEPVDSLDSDSTQLPLAAHQGKVLDGKISQLGQELNGDKKTESNVASSTWKTPFSGLSIQSGETFFLRVKSSVTFSRIIVAHTSGISANYLYDSYEAGKEVMLGFTAPVNIETLLVVLVVPTNTDIEYTLFAGNSVDMVLKDYALVKLEEKMSSFVLRSANLVNPYYTREFTAGQKGNEYPEYSIIGAALLNSFIEGNVAYNTTNMIPVESGQNYISSVPLRVLSYFNEYLVFVGFVSSQINANTPFAIPNGVKYIRASILTDYWSESIVINKGNEVAQYSKPFYLNPGIDGIGAGRDVETKIAENTNAIISLNGSRVTDENNIETLQQKVSDLEGAVESAVFEVGGVTYDSVPTEGSTKAITSGGVYTAFKNLKGSDNLAPKLNTNPVESIIRGHSFVSLFHDWGVIGASYDSGEMNYNNNQGAVDMYDFSWLQVMCRMNGVVGYNFSSGGWTAKTWCNNTGERGWGNGTIGASAPGNLKKAYIISYGENDQKVFSDAANPQYLDGNGMAGDLATDINYSGDFAPITGHDTFAGWMACIIQRIKSVQPKAVIFVKTMWHNRDDNKGVNTVIRDLPNYFTNIFVIDIWENHPSNMFDAVFFTGGHPNALGYEFFAAIFNTYIDWIVRSNYALFNQVQFIGTNYSY